MTRKTKKVRKVEYEKHQHDIRCSRERRDACRWSQRMEFADKLRDAMFNDPFDPLALSMALEDVILWHMWNS